MKKFLKQILKWSGLLAGLLCLLIFIGLSIYIALDIPHPKLVKLGEKYGSKWLKKELKIGRLDGPLFGKVVVYNLRVGNGPSIEKDGQMVYIKKLTLNYSILSTILSGGNILQSITKIKVEDLDLLVERKADNWWNVVHFFPPGKPGSKPKRMYMKVELVNAGGRFIDYQGFVKKKFYRPMTMAYRNLNGVVNMKSYPKMQFSVDCEGERNGDKIKISSSGYYNFWTKKYSFNNDVRNLEMSAWADYALPWENVKILKGDANFLARLYKAKDIETGEPRFHYLISFSVSNARVKMPQFIDPVEKIKGRGVLGRGGVTFYGFKASANDIPFSITGSVIKYKEWALKFKTEKSNLIKAQRLLTFLKDWEAEGDFQADIDLEGPTKQPKFSGNIEVFRGSARGVPIKNLKSEFVYENKKVNFNITEALIYGGNSKATGTVDMGGGKHFNVDFDINGANFGEVLGQPNYARGKIKSKIYATGYPENYTIKADVVSLGAAYMAQKFDHANLYLSYRNKKFFIEETPIVVNSSPLYFRGWLGANRQFDFTIYCNKFPLRGLVWNKNVLNGILNLNGTISGIAGSKRKGEKARNISGDFVIALDKLVIDKQSFDAVNTYLKVKDNLYEIKNFIARSGKGIITVNGLFDKNGLIGIKGDAVDVSLEKLEAVKKYLPEGSKEIGGLTKADFIVKRNKDFNPVSGMKSAAGFDIEGSIYLTKAYFYNQPFEEVKMSFYWDGKKIHSRETALRSENSIVYLDGEIGRNGNLNLNIKENTVLDLSDFNPFITKIGELNGIAVFTGKLRGSLKKPAFYGRGEVKKFSYNDLNIDYLGGELGWQNQVLNLDTFTIQQMEDVYRVNGYIDFKKDQKEKVFSKNYDLDIKIENSNVKTLNSLAKNLLDVGKRRKVKETLARQYSERKMFIKTPNDYQTLILYEAAEKGKSILKFFNEKIKELVSLKKPQETELIKNLSGILVANIDMNRNGDIKDIKATGRIINGRFNFLNFKEMNFTIEDEGKYLNAGFMVEQGNMGASNFDFLETYGKYDDEGGNFFIKGFNVSRKNKVSKNILAGIVPIKAFWDRNYSENPLSIKVKLKDNDMGIISVLGNFVEDIENQGNIDIDITGTLKKPVINASVFEVKNARFKLPQFPSYFVAEKADVSLKKNVFLIKSLPLKWNGEETQKKTNDLFITGKVNVNYFNLLDFDKAVMDLDLKMRDVTLNLDLDMLKGKAELHNLFLKGPITFALSKAEKIKQKQKITEEKEEGPVLGGSIGIEEGKIGLPKERNGENGYGKPSMLYQISCNFAKNISMKGGGITSFVGNFDLELEETKKPIMILGTNNKVSMKGRIAFVSGKFGMLNKNFYILKPEEQRKYFMPFVEKIKDNSIEFGGHGSGKKEKYEPIASIVAETRLHVLEEGVGSSGPTLNYIENAFLVICDGSLYNRSSISFERYSLKSKLRPEIVGTPYSMADIDEARLGELLGYLLPDLINPQYYGGAVKTSSKENNFFASLTETQIDKIFKEGFLSPLERRIERGIGLYDLKLDYNLGESLSEAIRGSKGTGETGLGIEVAQKLFFDRMFIRVKTRIHGARAIQFTEYELSYFITNWLSLKYENKQYNENDPMRGAFSLEANYVF